MLRRLIVALACLSSATAGFAAERITVAAGAQGNWETAAAQLGIQQGFFARHGLDVQLL